MITAREIAQIVGVSVSTVGRALSDDPRISDETKAKVKRAAAQAGYVGNGPARIMRGGSSNLIGLILPDVRNDFYAEIAQALSMTCDREGYRIVLSITGDDRDLEARHLKELALARAAGVIIVPTASPRRESIQMLQGLEHVQLLRRIGSLGNVWFGIDDEIALAEATRHLLDLGHRKIAYVGGHETLSTGASRVRGFRNAHQGAAHEGATALEVLGPPTHQFGAEAIKKLLLSKDAPTAVLTGSAHITLGMIETIERLGIDVPRQLSMIGFGDPQWFSWWRGGLTTVRPPVEALATACGLWFLHKLRGRESAAVPGHSSVASSTLMVRASTSIPEGPLL